MDVMTSLESVSKDVIAFVLEVNCVRVNKQLFKYKMIPNHHPNILKIEE